jgi:ABC-2 type transport system ATP-binding protein
MIEIQKISMKYGATHALNSVSFSVKAGEILGLLGPNGAGKSTLMKILTTFIYPSSGTATIGGYDILNDPLKVRELVGYLPENVPLYMDMRVDEYLAFVGNARGISGKLLKERFEWIIESCGIRPVWKHTINQLSKGYKQRVGLAQSLIHDPKVLILDEPTSGLDPLQIIGIRTLIKSLSEKKTIVFSTHILQEVEAIADRIVIINEGSIISQGSRLELAESAMKYKTFILTVKEKRKEVETALGALRSAKDIRFVDADKDGCVTFEIHTSFHESDAWSEIDALSKQKKWPIRSFSERNFNLEDLFISLLSKHSKQRVVN